MTTAPLFTIDDSATDPDADVWFAEPAGFAAIPLDALLAYPGSSAADKLRGSFAPFLDAATNETARQQFISQLAQGQQLLGALSEFGIVHCSIGLHHDDVHETGATSGRPLLSFFTISWRDVAIAPRGVIAARAVTSTAGHTHIEYLELPCGPATLSETALTASVDSGLPQQPLLQVHAHVPHPDCKRLAVFTMNTTAVARRAEYRVILRQVVETVSFENPLEFGTSAER